MAVTTSMIDAANSLRGQQINPGTVAGNITPQVAQTQQGTAQSAATPAQVQAERIANAGQVDPGAVAQAEAQRASGGANLAHNINAQSVMQNAMNAFQSQLPQLNIDFADQSDALAKRTAAMGRTGSGLFNRDTGYISDRARAAREGLLGNLSFNAATTDAANNLQAQIQQQQLREAQQNRFANVNVANMQSANQLAGQNAGFQNNALMQNAGLANQVAMANAANALKAGLANQQMAGQIGMFNAGQGNQMSQFNAGQANNMNQFNAGNDLQAQLANMQNAIGQNQFNANFMAGQQQYQNQLANQAQQDLYNQMMLFGQGFNGMPAGQIGQNAGGIAGIGQEYGANAGQAGQQAGQGAQSLVQMLLGGIGGALPAGSSQVPGYSPSGMPYNNDPNSMSFNPDPALFSPGPQPIGLQPAQPNAGLETFMRGRPQIVAPQIDGMI